MPERVRIVAIAQVYNELQRGNLRRFVDHLKPLVDGIIFFDNGSTDGSWQYLNKVTPHLLRGLRNDFVHERSIREQLLDKAMALNPDFILWLDADEVLTANTKIELVNAARWCQDNDFDGVALHELNLWRSGSWRRIDNAYDDGWFVRLWRVRPELRFAPTGPGLHHQLYPESIRKIGRYTALSVIHYGFSNDDQILFKYLNYQKLGQSGWELDRLIDESTLSLERVPDQLLPLDLRNHDDKPEQRPIQWWLRETQIRQPEILRPKVSVVSLIYKSTQWLKFCYEQILKYTDLQETEFFFIANDAADHVRSYLRENYIPHYVFDNSEEHKKEWYINNVYRAWNFAAQQAKGEYVLFVNSDMAFSPDWVEKMLSQVDGHNCIASRLVESGKMPSGLHGISRNLGQTLETFNEAAFQKFGLEVQKNELHDGGLFMPLLIRRDDFLGVGGYPEGNIVPGTDPFNPVIAKKGDAITSGDVVLMDKLKQRGIKHQTDFNTICYHFQEGEMDDSGHPMNRKLQPTVAIVNDWLTGRMGERTMWNMLVEGPPNVIGLDQHIVGESSNFTTRIRDLLNKHYKQTRIILQNASFIDRVDSNRWTIMFLQDDLRRMGRPSEQQERNLKLAETLVTNSWLTARSYPEYNFEIIPLGVDEKIFHPMDREQVRREFELPNKPTAIFVGDLSPVKGWNEIEPIISSRPDLHWILVSKKEELYSAPNVTMFNRLDQLTLAKLYNAADVFIIGSPVETQCLAAIEAGMCDTPIVMHETGIFWSWSEEQRNKVGWFGPDLREGIQNILSRTNTLSPRRQMLEAGLTVESMVRRWKTLLTEVVSLERQNAIRQSQVPLFRRTSAQIRLITRDGVSGAVGSLKQILKKILPKRLADALGRLIYERKF